MHGAFAANTRTTLPSVYIIHQVQRTTASSSVSLKTRSYTVDRFLKWLGPFRLHEYLHETLKSASEHNFRFRLNLKETDQFPATHSSSHLYIFEHRSLVAVPTSLSPPHLSLRRMPRDENFFASLSRQMNELESILTRFISGMTPHSFSEFPKLYSIAEWVC